MVGVGVAGMAEGVGNAIQRIHFCSGFSGNRMMFDISLYPVMTRFIDSMAGLTFDKLASASSDMVH